MAQIVKLKRTSVAGRTPTTSNIEVGELAFNSNDKSLFIRGDSNAIVAIHDESTLHIDTTNNRIGIGTTAPDSKLTIYNAATGITGLVKLWTNTSNNTAADGGAIEWIGSGDKTAVGSKIAATRVEGGGKMDLRFYTGRNSDSDHEKMRILVNGNVGIGTTAPGATLEVNGTVRADLIQTTTNNMSTFSYLNLDTDTGSSSGTNNVTLASVNNMDFLIDTNNNSTDSAFVFGTNANSMSSSTELMRLKESGQLLISATSTSFSDKFYINNTAYSTGGFRTGSAATFVGKMYNNSGILSLEADTNRDIQFGDAGTAAVMYIDNSTERVGIGTSSPAKLLHLSETADGSKLRLTRGGVSEWDFSIGNTSTLTGVGSGALEILPQNSGTANEIAIGTAGTTAPLVHITNSQNYFSKKIGIGTTSPDTKLDITTAGAEGLIINQDTGNASVSSRLFFKDNSGTSALLNVSGQFEIRTGATVASSSGTRRLVVKPTGAIVFNEAYTFPTSDGSANQVLQTDGSGNLSFATVQAGGGGTVSESFKNIAVSGQSTIIADAATDTLTLAAGAGMTITTNASSDTVTFSAGTDFQDSDGDTKIQVEESSDDDTIRFDTAGTERVVLDASGNFTIKGSNADLTLGSSGNDITFNRNSDNYINAQAGTSSNIVINPENRFAVNTSDTERLRITASGDTQIRSGKKLSVFRDTNAAALEISMAADEKITFRNNYANKDFVWTRDAKFGIGLTAPSTSLQVKSIGSDDGIYLVRSNNTNLLGGIIQTGSADGALVLRNTSNSQTVLFRGQGNNYLSGGSLAIGHTSPARTLHVNSSGTNVTARFESTDSIAAIELKDPNGSAEIGNVGNDLALFPAGVEKARLTSAGNLGIGTTSPASLLTVHNSSTAGNTELHVHNNKSGDAAVLKLEGKRTSTNDTGQLIFANNGNNVSKIDAQSAADDGNLRFFTSASGSGSIMTERMQINSSGSVGIGTTSPQNTLHVNGTLRVGPYFATSDRDHFLVTPGGVLTTVSTPNENANYDNSAGNIHIRTNSGYNTPVERLTVTSAGNVGIGTTSPSRLLHIKGSGSTVAAKVEATDGNQASLDLTNSEGAFRIINDNGGLSFHDDTDGATRLTINTSGNVGIGTTAPERALHVVGGIHLPNNNIISWDQADGTLRNAIYVDSGDDMIIGDTNFDDIYFSTGQKTKTVVIKQTTGNVGIGTTSPDFTLDVNPSGGAYSAGDNIMAVFQSATDHQTALKIKNINTNTTASAPRAALDLDTADHEAGSGARLRAQFVLRSSAASGSGGETSITVPKDLRFFVNNKGTLNDSSGEQASSSLVAGTEAMRITDAGNVGIGVTDPDQKLEVNGNIRIPNTGKIVFGSAGAAPGDYLELNDVSSSGSLLKLVQDSVTRFAIQGVTGNVGIGTTTPGYKLELAADTNSSVDLLRLRNSDSTYAQTMDFELDTSKNLVIHGSSGAGGAIFDIGSNGFVLKQNGSQHMKFTSNDIDVTGNLTLDVAGQINIDSGNDEIHLRGSGTTFGKLFTSGGDFYINHPTSDEDIIFRGNDGGSGINALTLDMSEAGAATFNANVTAPNLVATTATYSPILYGGNSNLQLKSNTSEMFAQFVNNGAAELYHDNVKKFETTANGVKVQGPNGYVELEAKNTGGYHIYTDRPRFYFNKRLSLIENILTSYDADLQLQRLGSTKLTLNSTGASVGGNLTVSGDLTVNGTQTTLNTATLQVEDKNIVLNYHASNDTSSTADGAGITIQDAVNGSNDASITWNAAGDKFLTSHPIRAFGGFELPDNNKLVAGDSNDLQIYHDGSFSYIKDLGTGGLYLDTNGDAIYLRGTTGNKNMVKAIKDGSVELYYNGSKKFETTNEGVEINDTYDISSENTTTSATTQTTIDTFTASAFRSCRYTIQVSNTTDTEFHTTELLLVHDGTTPGITEFGSIFTGAAAEATFDADISSGNVRLRATPASADSMTFKVVRHAITA